MLQPVRWSSFGGKKKYSKMLGAWQGRYQTFSAGFLSREWWSSGYYEYLIHFADEWNIHVFCEAPHATYVPDQRATGRWRMELPNQVIGR
jgi:hypothetical protein